MIEIILGIIIVAILIEVFPLLKAFFYLGLAICGVYVVGMVAAWLTSNRDLILKNFWDVHRSAAALVLYIVRDIPIVHLWPDDASKRAVRVAIVTWLLFPLFMAFGLLWVIATPWDLILLSSLATIVYGYYLDCFTRPVQHKRWPRFMVHYKLVQVEGKLTWLSWITRLKVWWLLHRGDTYDPLSINKVDTHKKRKDRDQ